VVGSMLIIKSPLVSALVGNIYVKVLITIAIPNNFLYMEGFFYRIKFFSTYYN